jgi:hypothetical protein
MGTVCGSSRSSAYGESLALRPTNRLPSPLPSPASGRGRKNSPVRFNENKPFENMMVRDLTEIISDEWLEGRRSRRLRVRYRLGHPHTAVSCVAALLLTATKPPSGRFVLVNGFDASVKTASGTYALSSQLYPSDVMHPDGAKRIVKFTSEPWPKWIFALGRRNQS